MFQIYPTTYNGKEIKVYSCSSNQMEKVDFCEKLELVQLEKRKDWKVSHSGFYISRRKQKIRITTSELLKHNPEIILEKIEVRGKHNFIDSL